MKAQVKRNKRYRRKKRQREREEYKQQRHDDLRHYCQRADLTIAGIARTFGLSKDVLYQVTSGANLLSDQKITVIIDFIKDYERLQTYYCALMGHRKQKRERELRKHNQSVENETCAESSPPSS